jgi:hypothetical protein
LSLVSMLKCTLCAVAALAAAPGVFLPALVE